MRDFMSMEAVFSICVQLHQFDCCFASTTKAGPSNPASVYVLTFFLGINHKSLMTKIRANSYLHLALFSATLKLTHPRLVS